MDLSEFSKKVSSKYKNRISEFDEAHEAIHQAARGKDVINQLPDKKIDFER